MTARQTIGLLLLVIFLPNCYSWRTYEGEGPPIDEEQVRVYHRAGPQVLVPPGAPAEAGTITQEDWGTVVLWNPFVLEEAFVGASAIKTPAEVIRQIPIASVQEYQVRRISWVPTTLVMLTVGALVAGMAYVLTGDDFDMGTLQYPGS
jgi:hypothetical protein